MLFLLQLAFNSGNILHFTYAEENEEKVQIATIVL